MAEAGRTLPWSLWRKRGPGTPGFHSGLQTVREQLSAVLSQQGRGALLWPSQGTHTTSKTSLWGSLCLSPCQRRLRRALQGGHPGASGILPVPRPPQGRRTPTWPVSRGSCSIQLWAPVQGAGGSPHHPSDHVGQALGSPGHPGYSGQRAWPPLPSRSITGWAARPACSLPASFHPRGLHPKSSVWPRTRVSKKEGGEALSALCGRPASCSGAGEGGHSQWPEALAPHKAGLLLPQGGGGEGERGATGPQGVPGQGGEQSLGPPQGAQSGPLQDPVDTLVPRIHWPDG